MTAKYLFKDTFAVIGKAGQGSANNASWIPPLWEDAGAHYEEIAALCRKSENGGLFWWGAMNDATESNKRWDDITGKYMAGCEADVDAQPPEGWTKWIIPAQTYLVAEASPNKYGEVFGAVTADKSIEIIGAVHEFYPVPEDTSKIELWFPLAAGLTYCQCCAMPLINPEDFGTEADGSSGRDYCGYCYKKGVFETADTMEQVIEDCIPFCVQSGVYPNAEAARADMLSYFPKLKRWAKL